MIHDDHLHIYNMSISFNRYKTILRYKMHEERTTELKLCMTDIEIQRYPCLV